jgi:hypothetical protein
MPSTCTTLNDLHSSVFGSLLIGQGQDFEVMPRLVSPGDLPAPVAPVNHVYDLAFAITIVVTTVLVPSQSQHTRVLRSHHRNKIQGKPQSE